jgi:hypothetical protein
MLEAADEAKSLPVKAAWNRWLCELGCPEMRHNFLLTGLLALLVSLVSYAPAARADIDLSGVLLLGSGVDTGKANNNPYAFQFGGAAELTLMRWGVRARGTRSLGTDKGAECNGSPCPPYVKDLRTFGADFGWDWEIAMLHISPRVGAGYINERSGDRVTGYVEPGGVAEIELGWFVAGADVRYRFAIKEGDLNGVLAYARLGLRF